MSLTASLERHQEIGPSVNSLIPDPVEVWRPGATTLASYLPASSFVLTRVRSIVDAGVAMQEEKTPMGDERGSRAAEAIVYRVLKIG